MAVEHPQAGEVRAGGTLRYGVDPDGVCLLVFDRPERRNAMTMEMFRGYFDALAEADADPAVRAVVVTGAGAAFCAGADVEALAALTGAEAQRELGLALGHPPYLPLTLRKPLIAAVNGGAAGLGLVHALCADLRFAAEGAKLTTAFSRRGLVAEYGAAWLLPRLVGLPNALDLLLSGRTVFAEEALGMGLVQRVLPPGEVVDAALAYARELALHCSPASMAAIKRQVLQDQERPLAEAADDALGLMLRSFSGADFAEGVAALLERRPAAYPPLPAPPDREPA